MNGLSQEMALLEKMNQWDANATEINEMDETPLQAEWKEKAIMKLFFREQAPCDIAAF